MQFDQYSSLLLCLCAGLRTMSCITKRSRTCFKSEQLAALRRLYEGGLNSAKAASEQQIAEAAEQTNLSAAVIKVLQGISFFVKCFKFMFALMEAINMGGENIKRNCNKCTKAFVFRK
jgi:hypothetical protein